jgi:hypothetical protein
MDRYVTHVVILLGVLMVALLARPDASLRVSAHAAAPAAQADHRVAADGVDTPWTFADAGGEMAFRGDVQPLRAASIVPIFADGGFGPTRGTITSPANDREALSAGGVDSVGAICADSRSRAFAAWRGVHRSPLVY